MSHQYQRIAITVNPILHLNDGSLYQLELHWHVVNDVYWLGRSVPLPHKIQKGLYLTVWREDITEFNTKLNQKEKGWALWQRYDYKLLRM